MKRDMSNATILGVCAGLARGIGLDPLWIRLFFLFLFVQFGAGLLVYLLLAVLMPKDEAR